MNVRPLVIDAPTRERMQQVRAYAELNPIDMRNPTDCAGDRPEHVVDLSFGYRVVYSVDRMPEPMGLTRRLSVSVSSDSDDALPNPVAVIEIADLFEMKIADIDSLGLNPYGDDGERYAFMLIQVVDRSRVDDLRAAGYLPPPKNLQNVIDRLIGRA